MIYEMVMQGPSVCPSMLIWRGVKEAGLATLSVRTEDMLALRVTNHYLASLSIQLSLKVSQETLATQPEHCSPQEVRQEYTTDYG